MSNTEILQNYLNDIEHRLVEKMAELAECSKEQMKREIQTNPEMNSYFKKCRTKVLKEMHEAA